MADQIQFIRDLFGKADVSLSQNDVWSVQGTPVVKHKALERLAVAKKIKFQPPIVLRAERDEAVILVTGTIEMPPNAGQDPVEWSIGEALVNDGENTVGNYKVKGKMAAYPYAMAEKRAKDRVILKLAGLHGVYSEEEADEFKESSGPTMSERAELAEKKIVAAKTDAELTQIWRGLDDDLKPIFRARIAKLGEALKKKVAA
jgi:hypothetical protein